MQLAKGNLWGGRGENKGSPVTPGFQNIRQAGESVSVILILENGIIGYGDCTAVQYSGTGGRDPLFLSEKYIPFLIENVKPALLGMDIS